MIGYTNLKIRAKIVGSTLILTLPIMKISFTEIITTERLSQSEKL
jgi:hypothetical protein